MYDNINLENCQYVSNTKFSPKNRNNQYQLPTQVSQPSTQLQGNLQFPINISSKVHNAKKKNNIINAHNTSSSINSTKGNGYKVSSKYQQVIKNQIGNQHHQQQDRSDLGNSDLFSQGSQPIIQNPSRSAAIANLVKQQHSQGQPFSKQKSLVGQRPLVAHQPVMTSADEQYNYAIPGEQIYSQGNLHKFT